MLRFYMDQHVHAELTRGLRQRGIDVLTAFDDGKANWDDEALLTHSCELQRIFVTQDQDFLSICRRWQLEGREFPGLVFVGRQRFVMTQIVEYLELLAKILTKDEMRNRVEFIPFDKLE
jgi:hypothetical protein